MSPTIAIVHYCEGAGHATRMVAIARALDAAGADVHIAGGGAGSQYVTLNGYDSYEPTVVDYITDYQEGTISDVVTGSVLNSARRITDIVSWLRGIGPDALVTDDMFAAMAAVRIGVPQYILKHDTPSIYDDRLERLGAHFHCSFQSAAARTFFYPSVWTSDSSDTTDFTHVPPVALEGPDVDVPDDIDVVVVPSHYSNLGPIAEQLADHGKTVLNVGSESWESVPALLPYLRAANVVVCSGYSTVMEAAVAGTTCVVFPATDEQVGVARHLEDLSGFEVVTDVDAAVAAAEAPSAAPEYENGDTVIASEILDDLESQHSQTESSKQMISRRNILRGGAAAGAAAVGATATTAADGRKPYHFRYSRAADKSLDRTEALEEIQAALKHYDGNWPAEFHDLPADRFSGATIDAIHLTEMFKRVRGSAAIRVMQCTTTLDTSSADYRHWLWIGVDVSNSQVQTGVVRRHPTEIEPRHLRIAFAPTDGTIEHAQIPPTTQTATSSSTAFMPDESPPAHPAGKPPENAASFVWQGKNTRTLSFIGVCESSFPTTTASWVGSQWQIVCEFRPDLPR